MCDLMHQAAAVSNCDWGVEQPIMPETRLPHLSACRNIARAAVWSVDHCRTNDPSGAVDDLVATSRLGQDVSSPATLLIGHLVDLAIQGLVVESVAGHASLLTRADDARLMELLNDANYDEGLRQAIEQEAAMHIRVADELAAMPPDEAMRALVTVGDGSSASQIQSLGTTQAIADFRQAAELESEYAKALEMPEAECRAWLTSRDEAGKTNPFVELLVKPLEQSVSKTQAATVGSAMAVAGRRSCRMGRTHSDAYPDPANASRLPIAKPTMASLSNRPFDAMESR